MERRLPLGQTRVNLTLQTSGSSRTPSTCSFDVVVTDEEAPRLVCPAAFEHAVSPGLDYWYGIVPFPPVASDNSRVLPSISAALLQNGGRFDVRRNTTIGAGNHTLVYYAIDAAGNVANCTTAVAVKDRQKPEIACPTLPASFSTDFRQPTRTMQLPPATATDNNQVSSSRSVLLQEEAVYPLGTTSVTFTAEDTSGNAATCTVDVHVVDTEAPRAVCPRPAVTGAFTRPGAGYARLAYKGGLNGAAANGVALVAQTLPGATFKDNVVNATGAKIVASSGADGTNHVFQIGKSKVAYTPIDGAGNVGQRCLLTVAVLGCPSATAYALEASPGTRFRDFALPDPIEAARLGGSGNLPSDLVLVTSHPFRSHSWPLGTTEVSWNLTTKNGGDVVSTCLFPVTVLDKDPPKIACPPPLTRVLFVSDNEDAIELEYTGAPWKQTDKYATSVLPAASASDASGFAPDVRSSLGAAGTFTLGPGITVVNFTASDDAGNAHSCDVTYVVLRCPSSLLYNTSAGMSSVEFDFVPRRAGSLVGATPALALLNSATQRDIDERVSAAVLLRASHPDKHVYEVGTTNVSLSLLPSGEPESFAPGEHGQCGFAVTVQDKEPPTLACPTGAAATFVAQDGTSSWTGVLSDPETLLDNADLAPVVSFAVTSSVPSSALVPIEQEVTLGVGVHAVEYRARDRAGNEAACTASIRIADREKPTIVCPTLQDTYATDTGSPTRMMQLPAAVASDNFRLSANSSTLKHAEASYALGSTTVTFVAVDEDNNSAHCKVTVVVVDTEAPSIQCPQPRAVGIFTHPGIAYATLGYHGDIHHKELATDTLPYPTLIDNSGNGSSAGGRVIASSGDAGTNHVFQPGKTTVKFTPVDEAGNIGLPCSVDIVVIKCPSDSQFQLQTTSASAPSSSSPSSSSTVPGTARYTLTDPFAALEAGLPASLAYATSHPTSEFPLGTTVVTWNLTDMDSSNLLSSCTFPVEVSDAHAPTVKCQELAADRFVFDTDLLSGSTLFGPESNSSFPMATAVDNGGSATLAITATVAGQPATGNAAAFRLPIGEHFITYSATDDAGNTGNCVRAVSIVDNERPRISCPSLPTSYSTSAGLSHLEMGSIPAAKASDNSAAVTVTVTGDDGAARTSTFFPVGETRLQYVARDESGNEALCAVYVVVRDTEVPTIQCPPNTTVLADPGACSSQMVEFPSAIADDNVRVQAISSTHASPIPFTAGSVQPITDTAVDSHGNRASCTHFITFVDATPPSITCPRLAATAASLDDAAIMFDSAASRATDNCDAVVLLESSYMPGSGLVQYGLTTVNYTATDSSGNVAACAVSIYTDAPSTRTETTPGAASERGDTTIYPSTNNETFDLLNATDATARSAASLIPFGIALVALIVITFIFVLVNRSADKKKRANTKTRALAPLHSVLHGHVDAPRIDRVNHSVVLTCNTPGAVVWYSWTGSVAPGDTQQAEAAVQSNRTGAAMSLGGNLGASSSTDGDTLAATGTHVYHEGERLTVPVPPDSFEPTLSVVATKSGMHQSQVVFAEIEVGQVDAPDIVASSDGISVNITCPLPGAQVWYSWDGIPTPSGASERDGVPSNHAHTRICTLTLTKDPAKGYGFALRSSADHRRHVVISVQPSGSSHGIMFAGDTLVAINGTSTVGQTHTEVMQAVQQSASMVVKVERGAVQSSTVNVEVDLARSTMSESFGLALGVSDDNTLYVSGIGLDKRMHASYPPAGGSRGGTLQAGDVVLSVNGNDIASHSHAQVKDQIGELLILGLEVERSGGVKINASRTRPDMNGGFGITFGEDQSSGVTVITSVDPSAADDAAEAAALSGSDGGQLELHDVVLAIDGKSTAGVSQAEVMNLIGSKLQLKLLVQRKSADASDAGANDGTSASSPSGFDATVGGSVLLQHSRVVIPPADGAAGGVHPRLAAIAVKHGMRASTVTFFSIDMQQVATPDIRYSDGLVVIQSQTRGARIAWDLIESDLTISGSGKAKHSSGGGSSEFGCKFALNTRTPSQKILQAYATKARHANSAVAEIAVLIEAVQPPTITPGDGHLLLQAVTPGATIVYEWVADVNAHIGKDRVFNNPLSSASPEVYAPLDMRNAGTKSLIAACRKVGMAESQVVSWSTVIARVEAPVIAQTGCHVRLSTATPGARMYYRWNAHPQLEDEDMSDSDSPGMSTTLGYSPGEQIEIPDSADSNVLYAIAIKRGLVASHTSQFTAVLQRSAVPEICTSAGPVASARARRQDADSATTFAYVDAFPNPADNADFGSIHLRSMTPGSTVVSAVNGTVVESAQYTIDAGEAGQQEIQIYTRSGDPHYIDSFKRTIVVSIDQVPAPHVTIDDNDPSAQATFAITCPRRDAEIFYGVQKSTDEPDSYLEWTAYNPGATISCSLTAHSGDDDVDNVLVAKAVRAGMLQSGIVFTVLPQERELVDPNADARDALAQMHEEAQRMAEEARRAKAEAEALQAQLKDSEKLRRDKEMEDAMAARRARDAQDAADAAAAAEAARLAAVVEPAVETSESRAAMRSMQRKFQERMRPILANVMKKADGTVMTREMMHEAFHDELDETTLKQIQMMTNSNVHTEDEIFDLLDEHGDGEVTTLRFMQGLCGSHKSSMAKGMEHINPRTSSVRGVALEQKKKRKGVHKDLYNVDEGSTYGGSIEVPVR